MLNFDITGRVPASIRHTQRQPAAFNGRQIPVVSREGLKRLKLMAGRKQDLLDLEQLGLES